MAIRTRLIGTFKSDSRASRCIKRLCKLRIGPRSIAVAGASSNLMQVVTAQELKTFQQGKYMILLGISGALIGAAVATWAMLSGPVGGLLKEFGLALCLTVGAILGCAFGTMIGALVGSTLSEFIGSVSNVKLPGNKIMITVDFQKSSRQQAVEAIMQDCGAVAVLTQETDSSKIEPACGQ